MEVTRKLPEDAPLRLIGLLSLLPPISGSKWVHSEFVQRKMFRPATVSVAPDEPGTNDVGSGNCAETSRILKKSAFSAQKLLSVPLRSQRARSSAVNCP